MLFQPVLKSELSQVSLTGMRAIILLGLLTESPRTLKEIREAFISLNIMEEEHSDDIIRIDLNTLRCMGCDISQSTRKTNYHYVLNKSPFAINILDDEIDVIKKAYKKIKESCNIDILLKYHHFFNNLASYVSDENIKEKLYGISVLKSYDCNLINQILTETKAHKLLTILYNTPGTNNTSEKNILTQELVFHNDKIYLYGFDKDKNRSVVLNIQRIIKLLGSIVSGDDINIKKTYVKFLLKDIDMIEIQSYEHILETTSNGYVIEGNYYNDFVAIQRILSFGANCTVLEPYEFKQKIINKLLSMRNIYNGNN